ncbi:hypothetical protein LXL04_002516 [Taraxacum kok-saghyz]
MYIPLSPSLLFLIPVYNHITHRGGTRMVPGTPVLSLRSIQEPFFWMLLIHVEISMDRCLRVLLQVGFDNFTISLGCCLWRLGDLWFSKFVVKSDDWYPNCFSKCLGENLQLKLEFDVSEGSQGTPFAGGYYYGKIKFLADYPFKHPEITMTTPDGQFITQKEICLSTSDFHPESWNPMYIFQNCDGKVLYRNMNNSGYQNRRQWWKRCRMVELKWKATGG